MTAQRSSPGVAPFSAEPNPPPAGHAPEQAHPGELGFALPPPAQISRARALAIGAMAVAVLAAAFLLRFLPQQHARAALEAETRGAETGALRVQVVAPTVASSDRAIELPGSAQPLE